MNTQSTPETDAYAIKIKTPCGEKYWVPVDIARKLERELAEARGQRDRLAEELELIRDYQGMFAEDDPQSIATKALQSLTTNQP